MRRCLLPCLVIFLIALPLLAHKGKKHSPPAQSAKNEPKQAARKVKRNLEEVNTQYLKKIRPIFRKKCFDCHATAEKLPWYAKIPGPKQLIQKDIREAKKHMDMRSDFPFGGHGTPQEDLVAIEGVLKDGSMPPWRYRIMHRGAKLTKEEIAAIGKWIETSKPFLAPRH